MGWNREELEAVAAEVLRRLGVDEREPDGEAGGVLLRKTAGVVCQPFQGRENVRVKDLTTLAEAPRIAAGVMEVERTVFDWTLGYDEFDIVLEGTLEIEVNGKALKGGAGDVFYIPNGTTISFRSPDKARFVYVTYPADWDKK